MTAMYWLAVALGGAVGALGRAVYEYESLKEGFVFPK